MKGKPNSFYVTLFINASMKDNTLHLAQELDLGNDRWEVFLCDFTCSPPAVGTYSDSQCFRRLCLEEALSVSTEFDIFVENPVQTSVQETMGTIYRPTASLDYREFEFLILELNDTYMDLNIRLCVRGKLTAADGTAFDANDFTT